MDLLENTVQNEFMLPFIDMIRKRSVTGDDQAKIAISLVQRIPNNGNRYVRTQTDWYFLMKSCITMRDQQQTSRSCWRIS